MIEIWKPVIGYEGLYEVSNLGRVKSLNYKRTGNKKILKPRINNKGYIHYCLSKNGKSEYLLAHRIVWSAFNGEIPKKYVINHLDYNPLNCTLSNLECVTQSQNMRHAHLKNIILISLSNKSDVLRFRDSADASEHFGYKYPSTIDKFINHAKKYNKDTISIRGKIWRFL